MGDPTRGKVLVIDDEATHRILAKEYLEAVAELTGDMQLTKAEIMKTQVCVYLLFV